MKSKHYTSLLGLSFEGGRLCAAHVRQSGSTLHVKKTLNVALSLDILTNDPELVGLEIRNHLSDAGIHERRCVVCVPQNWALAVQTKMPDLSDEDVESYLNVQAEREFPFSPRDLSIATSRHGSPSGARGATIVALQQNHLDIMQKVLKAARLRIVDVTIGVSALAGAAQDAMEEYKLLLLVGAKGIDMALVGGGGILSLRRLDAHAEGHEEGSAGIDPESIARQIRITLAQMPEEVRNAVRSVSMFGQSERAAPLIEALSEKLRRAGMDARPGELQMGARIVNGHDPAGINIAEVSALAAAARRILGQPFPLNFPLVKKRPQRVLFGKTFSRRALWFGGTMIALILGLGGAMVLQEVRLSRLGAEWKLLEPKQQEIDMMRDQIHFLRPWFTAEADNLLIYVAITEAFPHEGKGTSTESLTIEPPKRDSGATKFVTATAKVPDFQVWEEIQGRLAKTKGVSDIHIGQKDENEDSIEIPFSFNWKPGGNS